MVCAAYSLDGYNYVVCSFIEVLEEKKVCIRNVNIVWHKSHIHIGANNHAWMGGGLLHIHASIYIHSISLSHSSSNDPKKVKGSRFHE